MRDTQLGFWSAAILDELVELFDSIKPAKNATFLDLGSGDERVVLLAALYGFRATGIECDDELVATSKDFQKKLAIENATLLCDNFVNHDLSMYDYLFINPDKPFHRGVEENLHKELKGTLIVFSDVFFPLKLQKITQVTSRITIYRS